MVCSHIPCTHSPISNCAGVTLSLWNRSYDLFSKPNVIYSARPFIRKSNSSIIRKIRHIHWELGKLSVYFAQSYLRH